MAYSATVDIKALGNTRVVTITETDCGAGDEATISLGFSKGRVIKQASALTSGDASTVNPVLGTASNPAGNDIVVSNVTAADPVANVVSGGGMPFDCTGVLYHRSKPDAGANNVIESVYYIFTGWA